MYKRQAFGIPVLESVDASSHKTQVIILSPTRELAIQVADEIRQLAKYMHGVKEMCIRDRLKAIRCCSREMSCHRSRRGM